jgi:hypothetical protein
VILYIQVCHPESLLLFHHHHNHNHNRRRRHHHHHRQSSPFLATAFLRNSVRFHPVFTSLDFATLILLQNKVSRLASNTQPGEPDSCIYVPTDRVAQLYPQGPGSLCIVSCDSQGCGGVIPNTGNCYFIFTSILNCCPFQLTCISMSHIMDQSRKHQLFLCALRITNYRT